MFYVQIAGANGRKSIFVQAAAKSRTCSDYGEAQPKMDEVKPAAKRLTTHYPLKS